MARYPFPWDIFCSLMLDLPARHTRSLTDDCARMLARVQPSPVIMGSEHVPSHGPVVVAANHFQRRGLWIGWPGAAISLAVAERRNGQAIHWLVTGGLRWQQWRGRGPAVPLTETMFKAVARTYSMAALPLGSGHKRAASLRLWLRWVRSGEAVGIFPEGLIGRSDGLRLPEPGFESLCWVLGRMDVGFLPCGIFEEDDVLRVRFGNLLPARDVDSGQRVMEGIAELLPPELRGPYRDALGGDLSAAGSPVLRREP